MENQEIPEQMQEDILNAELTPDERMVAEEDAINLVNEQNAGPENDPEQPQVDPQSNGQVIDDYTVRRAKDYNFTDEYIESFSDSSQLESALNEMDQQVLAKLSEAGVQTQQSEPENVGPLVEQTPSDENTGLQFDDYMDPTVKKNFEMLKEQHDALVQYIQGQLQNDEMSQFDDRCSNLGDVFHPLLGATIEERRDQSTEAFANASQLWDVYRQLQKISPNMTDDDVFRRAVAATFPDQHVQFAEQRVRHDVSDRLRDTQGRFVARPSKRGAVSQPPGQDQDAQNWIDTWASERGIRMAPAMSIDEMLDS